MPSGIVAILEHVLKAVVIIGRDFLSITRGLNPVRTFTAMQKNMLSRIYPAMRVKSIPNTDRRVSTPVLIIIEATEQNIARGTMNMNILVALMKTAVSSLKTSRRIFAPAMPTETPRITAITIICSMSPSSNGRMRFAGTKFISIPVNDIVLPCTVSTEGAIILTPAPGLNTCISPKAIAVLAS